MFNPRTKRFLNSFPLSQGGELHQTESSLEIMKEPSSESCFSDRGTTVRPRIIQALLSNLRKYNCPEK